MKKPLLIAPLLVLAFAGCKKVDQILTFTVDTSQTATIPGYFVGAQQLPNPVTVTTNSADSFKNNKTTRDKVKDVYLQQMNITMVTPADSTFNFLGRMDVYINTPNSNNKILLASINPVPRNAKTISLTPTNSRLDEYLKADTYQLTVDATVVRFSGQNFAVRADSKFKVTADPL